MEIENNLNTEKTILNNEINGKVQNNFLESTLGKTINAAVDIGLRWAIPDLIEDEVINIKNSLIKGGLKEGINTAVSSAIDLGKSAMGIFTGNFESISQAQNAVKTGITFGSALAMVISYTTWKSVGWAIFHGLLSWVYVIYFILRY